MDIEIDMPDGQPLQIAARIDEFIVDDPKDLEIYSTMPQAKMAGRRLLRLNPAIPYVDIIHRKRIGDEVSTENVETIERDVVIDL